MVTPVNPYTQLHRWYAKPLGQALSAEIQTRLDNALVQLFGYHIVQVGLPEQQAWLQKSPIAHRLYLSATQTLGASVVSPLDSLPFVACSVDVMLLPHTLEYAADAMHLLKEATRVLLPEGHLVVFGFNPISLWGVGKPLLKLGKRPPWVGHFINPVKMRNYLMSLGYKITYQSSFLYRPPIPQAKLFEHLLFLETLGRLVWPYPGGVYMMVAKKEVVSMTPIKPLFSFKSFVVGKRYVQPL